MIHDNENIKPIQKLYFLKQAMVGEAKNVLKDFALTEDLYVDAYEFVKNRYFNKRAIIASHFRELVNLPSVTVGTLRECLDKVKAIERGLKVCGIKVEKMSPLITYLVVTKLPERLRTDWEAYHLDHSTYPSFGTLSTYLHNRCFAHESVHFESSTKTSVSKGEQSKSSTSYEKRMKSPRRTSLASVSSHSSIHPSSSVFVPSCVACSREHYLSSCPTYATKSIADRFAFVKEKRLCINCLRKNHTVATCTASKCRKCGKTHHTTLHRDNVESPSSNTGGEIKNDLPKRDDEKPKANLLNSSSNTTILLPSAVVVVQIRSKRVKAHVLIDACSQANLVTESFIQQHRIPTHSKSSTISGIAPEDFCCISSAYLTLESRYNDTRLSIDADVVIRIPYQVESVVVNKLDDCSFELPLAECSLPTTAVDILIGGEFASKVLLGNKKFVGELCLEETKFGWIAQGPVSGTRIESKLSCNLNVLTTRRVQDELAQFWEVEEVLVPKGSKSSEHEMCEAHFLTNYCRLSNGRFQIRLPLKNDVSLLANTYTIARSALILSEKKYDSATRQTYIDFMAEYRNLQHMNRDCSTKARYFIPHLPVFRPESSTTKLRVVFNASARNSSGLSLNEALMNGPKMQPELFDTLLRFRSYRIAFSGDISKMYCQVVVHPDDRHLQSILWRDAPENPIETYELATLTYGTTPAAFVSTKCLQILAEEYQSQLPDASFAVGSSFYMDDLLTGADDVPTAIQKRIEIEGILASAQFPLRKYVSNSIEFLKAIQPKLVEELRPLKFVSADGAKILGLQWCPSKDEFSIKVRIEEIGNVILTKRIVSSLIAPVYDPLGLATPVTIRAKLLLQELWREGRNWDDPITEATAVQFRNYYDNLKLLSTFVVPRWYNACANASYKLIGFCDASSRAYAAVVYLRSSSNSIIICSKSRVAPVKEITIPRLELLGAVLLTQLITRVCKVLSFDIAKVRTFSDSTIVLAWLKGPSSKYDTFVRNRVSFVSENLQYEQWQYVSTKQNPADLSTRGIEPSALIGNKLWLHGPDSLQLDLLASKVLLPLLHPRGEH